ncbi:23S rRNA (uracil(1939)-C(5))-methyltransferase RlmD [Berryella wangjianweii]|uniref:23S rRNA (uracil(1939)-C(5))-methyltransferase RlmD n=1 Tax=Berryella wangjianweii TaxID=2734634 RepID=UPI0021BD9E4C|nr:23S rRNA (uracil(1939)-C(5))-methyltransferase RlmD [Berryella wangjianweii]
MSQGPKRRKGSRPASGVSAGVPAGDFLRTFAGASAADAAADAADAAAAAAGAPVADAAGASVAGAVDAAGAPAADFPRCPHETACGACAHIGLPYAQQLQVKQDLMAQLYSEAGLIEGADDPRLLPFLGMEHPYRYRNKVMSPFVPARGKPGGIDAGRAGDRRTHAAEARYGAGQSSRRSPARSHARSHARPHDRPHGRSDLAAARSDRASAVGQGGGGSGADILIGMYAPGTHRIVRTDGCLVENPQAQQVIRAVRSIMLRYGMLAYNEDSHQGFMRHVVVRVGHRSGEVLVTLVTNGDDFPASRSFCRELTRRCPFVTTVVQNVNERQTNVVLGSRERRLYGPGFILDELCGLSFRISSQSFYQVNAMQTEVLYRRTIELAQLSGTQRVIDAYCGTGTIGLVAAANGAREVVGVDAVESAIGDARENARHNGIDNARFVAADATAFMRDMARTGERADVVIMDPPRAGATEECLAAIAELGADRVAYVSCNPHTHARDLRFLAQQGYRLETLQGVDMFPHTAHVESICLMTRQ